MRGCMHQQLHLQTACEWKVSPKADERLKPSAGKTCQHCALCNRDIPISAWSSHVRGKPHNRRQRFVPLQQALEDSEKDKHGVTVESAKLNFGLIDVSEINREKVVRAVVRNALPISNIVMLQCRITSKINGVHDTGCAVSLNLHSSLMTISQLLCGCCAGKHTSLKFRTPQYSGPIQS